jgi:hypothetical protein
MIIDSDHETKLFDMIQNLPKVDCEKAVYERRDLKDRRGFLI